MSEAVQISFDCLPLRTVGRLDIPLDASAEYRTRCERLKRAITTHGQHNTYWVSGAECVFRLTNDEILGLLRFSFEGTILTDVNDLRTQQVDLEVKLLADSCDWITRPVVEWFEETVRRAVAIEFDRYIQSGDLARTVERLEQLAAENRAEGGYLGMGL